MRRASASNEGEYVLIAQPRRAFRPSAKEGSAQTIANVMEMVATFSLTSTIYGSDTPSLPVSICLAYDTHRYGILNQAGDYRITK